jgi:parallel beta-helix repeat protein
VNQNDIAPKAGLLRRDFLKRSMLLAAPLVAGTALTGFAFPAAAAVYVPPTRQRGSIVLNVKNYGAMGNGFHDDTAAFQAAIKALPSTGGTVYVPAGTYMINAVTSVKLRSLMLLQLDPSATMAALPNSASISSVVSADLVHDIEVAGGQIIGERDTHLGTTGEGGHCIVIRGCSAVTIRDIRLSRGWGDGLSVGPKPQYQKNFIYSRDVAVGNIVCTGNRRNGLSITNVIGMKVYDSEFSDTHGTSPQCGIDVEPNKDIDGNGYNDQVWIENCVMKGNAAYGVNVWKRSRNLTITKCTISGNKSCGIVTTGLTGGTFSNNTFNDNMKTGLFLQTGTTGVVVSNQTSFHNYLIQGLIDRSPAFYLTGWAKKIQKDLIVGSGTSNIQVMTNYYK